MDNLSIAKGDYGYYLDFTVKKADNTAYNLTGYAVRLKVWSAEEPDTLVLDGICSVDEGSNGTCHYLIAGGDFDKAGTYSAELELTKTGAKESTQLFTITVVESL